MADEAVHIDVSPAVVSDWLVEKGPTSGRVTIVADDYPTSMDCDAPHYSMRSVSVVKMVRHAS
ncbi:MAG: hypothetical protein ACR2JJ_11950 [Sphingomicrobium sp.]